MDVLMDSSRGNQVCSSVQEIQDRLHHLLASKLSETRAEHASSTFELRYHAVIHLNADAEDAPADAVVNPVTQPHEQPVTRSVNVSEMVQNQPGDDPVLQRAVAKHIVSALGLLDRSTWIAREVSRDQQGWTFTYICKDSLQAWHRANAKNAEKNAIGSYSGPGSLDPINASRPAFDCRGTLTIIFSKPARAVIVKYNHTPIHKTVGQLVDLIAPTLPPAPTNNNAGNQKTPRVKRPPPAEGEEGSRRKRARKKGKAPEAPMDGPSLGSGQNDQDNAESQSVDQNGSQIVSVLNVPPDEFERRKRTAIDLLNEKGIDPATLSEEQFSIFANQAPSLQTASLEMLVKYGAERLRIVHPDEKDQASTANTTPTGKQSTITTPVTGPGPTSTPGTTETPTKKRSRRKKPEPAAQLPIGDGAVVPVQQSGEIGTTTSTLTPARKKTRGSCETCRTKKVKCTKEHPRCSVCINSEVECVYLPPKPRRRRSGISGEVVENEDSDLPGESEQIRSQMQAEEEAQVSIPSQTHTDIPQAPDPDNEEFIPDPNILSGPIEQPPVAPEPSEQTSAMQYYPNSSDRLTFPPNPGPSPAQPSTPALTFPDSKLRETQAEPPPSLTFPSESHQIEHSSGLTFPQPTPTASRKRRGTSRSDRRSLPTGQNKQTPTQQPTPIPAIPQNTPNWNEAVMAGRANTVSPTLTQQQVSNRATVRTPDVEASQQINDGLQHVAALSQVAAQKQRQPTSVITSPYQAAARTKSRQDHRSRTSTPVASVSRPPPQAPQAAITASYNTTSSTSVPNYNPYSRYDNSTNGHYDNANGDQGSSRIAYEPGSYHATAAITSASYSSAPAYDYSRSSGSSNPLSQALAQSSAYSTTNNTTTPQWPTSQTRGNQPQSQSHQNNTYSMTATTATPSNSSNYGAGSTESRVSHQNTSYGQHQSQSYGSYSAQQPSTSQQSHQNWYGFNSTAHNNSSSANQNSYSSNRTNAYGGTTHSNQTAYNGHRSNVPNYSGHSYGSGSDDQSIYDLLRASGSAH